MARSSKQQESIASALQRLEKSIESGENYEALQIFEFILKRYWGQGLKTESQELADKAVALFTQRHEYSNASKVCVLFITCMEDKSTPCEQELVEKITEWVKFFPATAMLPVLDVLKAGARWAQDPQVEFEAALANVYRANGEYGAAARHFVQSECSAEDYRGLLEEWIRVGCYPSSERDLVLCRAILHLLSVTADQTAASLIALLQKDGDASLTDSPLWHFVTMITQLAQRSDCHNRSEAFNLLRNRYRSALARDPNLSKYLAEIGELYFGIEQPKAQGLLGDIMNLLSDV